MMQKTRSLSIRTIILLIASVLAITLCFTGTARAALAYFSPDYQAEFETTELKVGLTEQGEDQEVTLFEGDAENDAKLLTWMDGMTIIPGKTYQEILSAVNTGNQDEYVRVVVKKYWKNKEGKKVNTIDPVLIQLEQAEGWEEDTANSTDEQVVLYSTKMLTPGESLEFIKSIRIDPTIVTGADVKEKITPEGNKTIYTYSYVLDGYSFNIEAEVDAVQTHNAPDAIKNVWGYTVNENELS